MKQISYGEWLLRHKLDEIKETCVDCLNVTTTRWRSGQVLCESCDGHGTVENPDCVDPDCDGIKCEIECKECEGSGEVDCEYCGGKGYFNLTKEEYDRIYCKEMHILETYLKNIAIS
jgi:hypothetical protein